MKNKKTLIIVGFVLALALLSLFLEKKLTHRHINKRNEYVQVQLRIIDSLVDFNIELPKEKIFKERDRTIDKSLVNYYKASINLKRNKRDSILPFCNKSLMYLTDGQYPFLEARIYRQKAVYYKDLGDYPKSMEYLFRGLEYFEKKEPDSEFLGKIYSSLGGVNFKMGRMDKAKEYFEKSYQVAVNHNNFVGKMVANANQGNIHLVNQEYEEADKALYGGLLVFRELKDTINTINALNSTSVLRIYQNLYDEALQLTDEALKLSVHIKEPMNQAITYINYGNIYKELKNYEEALEYYTKSLKLARKENLVLQERDALLRMSEIYALNQDKDRAYDCLVEYYKVNEKIEGKNISNQIEDLKVDVFKNQNETIRQENKKFKILSKGYAVSGFLALLSAIAFGLLYRTKNKLLVLTRQENTYLNEKIKTEKEIKRLHKKQHEFENKAKEELQELKQKQYNTELDAKDRELTILNLKLISKSKLLNEIEEIIEGKDRAINVNKLKNIIRKNRNNEKEWKQFKEVFRTIHPTFFDTIEKNYPQLTKAEIRICAYIKINMSNEEISIILNISQSSLMTNRYRIRKKLTLDRAELLEEIVKSW